MREGAAFVRNSYTKESFENAMLKEPNTGCWLSDGKSLYGPYKISAKLFKGGIPKGLWVLHKCDTPACVNPDHLFFGDRRDNMIDAIKKKRQHESRKTHCPSGHPYDEKNTIIGKKTGWRYCGICQATKHLKKYL